MSNCSKTILTNMCMLYRPDGSFLVENRVKNDWPGINFPGGHVEKGESIVDSVIREMKEETGLLVKNPEFVSFFEWNMPEENVRHLCLLYRSKDFEGELHSSQEGKVFFLKKEDLPNYSLSKDFDQLLEILSRGLF